MSPVRHLGHVAVLHDEARMPTPPIPAAIFQKGIGRQICPQWAQMLKLVQRTATQGADALSVQDAKTLLLQNEAKLRRLGK